MNVVAAHVHLPAGVKILTAEVVLRELMKEVVEVLQEKAIVLVVVVPVVLILQAAVLLVEVVILQAVAAEVAVEVLLAAEVRQEAVAEDKKMTYL